MRAAFLAEVKISIYNLFHRMEFFFDVIVFFPLFLYKCEELFWYLIEWIVNILPVNNTTNKIGKQKNESAGLKGDIYWVGGRNGKLSQYIWETFT